MLPSAPAKIITATSNILGSLPQLNMVVCFAVYHAPLLTNTTCTSFAPCRCNLYITLIVLSGKTRIHLQNSSNEFCISKCCEHPSCCTQVFRQVFVEKECFDFLNCTELAFPACYRKSNAMIGCVLCLQ